MRAIRTLVPLVVVALAATASAESAVPCTEPGKVSIIVEQLPIRLFLQEIVEQGKLNVAVDPQLHGRISLSVSCVDARTALKLALPQIDAVFCETEKAVLVTKRAWAACGQPQPFVERISDEKAEGSRQ